MFKTLSPLLRRRPIHRLAHDVVDALSGRSIRRVVLVGDGASAVREVLRERLPSAQLVLLDDDDQSHQPWDGWADLAIAAWAHHSAPVSLAARLARVARPDGYVAVLDDGELSLVDALQRTVAAVGWAIESPPTGGEPTLTFLGRTAWAA